MAARESETIEFKKSAKELMEGVISLASMLNKSGTGTLYFGIENDGNIHGQPEAQTAITDIANTIAEQIRPGITPKIDILKGAGKEIIKISVQGTDTPYSAFNRYYIRSGDEDIAMSAEQLAHFFKQKEDTYAQWEQEDSGYGLDVVDEDLLIQYIREGIKCGRIPFLYKDAKTVLSKLHLLCGDSLNYAGYYLFANTKPLHLDLASYPTEERVQYSDKIEFQGNIFECIKEAIKYVTNRIYWDTTVQGINKVASPEIPIEALREVIINSFTHMHIPTDISLSNAIYITPSKVHIYNPGPLVPETNPEQFATGKQSSILRNPSIAMALYLNGTIDHFGTGFEKIFKLCNDGKYQYVNDSSGFTFEFIRNPFKQILNISPGIEPVDHIILTDDEKSIYSLIASGAHYTKNDLADKIGKSSSTVQRGIKKLTAMGLVERVGANKNGYWRAT